MTDCANAGAASAHDASTDATAKNSLTIDPLAIPVPVPPNTKYSIAPMRQDCGAGWAQPLARTAQAAGQMSAIWRKRLKTR